MPGKRRSIVARRVCKAGPIAIDGDELDVRTRNIAQGEREGAAAGAEIGPDAAAVAVDSGLDQLHVIGVVHQTTPLGEGLTRGGPGSKMAIVY